MGLALSKQAGPSSLQAPSAETEGDTVAQISHLTRPSPVATIESVQQGIHRVSSHSGHLVPRRAFRPQPASNSEPSTAIGTQTLTFKTHVQEARKRLAQDCTISEKFRAWLVCEQYSRDQRLSNLKMHEFMCGLIEKIGCKNTNTLYRGVRIDREVFESKKSELIDLFFANSNGLTPLELEKTMTSTSGNSETALHFASAYKETQKTQNIGIVFEVAPNSFQSLPCLFGGVMGEEEFFIKNSIDNSLNIELIPKAQKGKYGCEYFLVKIAN
jgi:hypothetical protein